MANKKITKDLNIGTLYIDSSSFDMVNFVFVPLNEGSKVISKTYALAKRNAETAKFLKKFLQLAVSGNTEQIAAFAIQTGEGSFAGMRTGIALALGMSFAFDIPVYAIDAKGKTKLITEALEIDYGAAPNIGVAKKKKLKQIKTA